MNFELKDYGIWKMLKSEVLVSQEIMVVFTFRFHISDCNKLKRLIIGENSFSHFSVFELRDLPTLESIEIGTIGIPSYNFVFSSLALESMD